MSVDGVKPNQPEAMLENNSGNAKGAQQKSADREKWLAELEKKSFQISDDQISQGSERTVLDRSSVDNTLPQKPSPWLAAGTFDAFTANVKAPGPALPGAALSPPLHAGLPPSMASSSAPRVQGHAGLVSSAQTALRPAINSPSVQSAQAAQRLDALMNRLRYMDLNVRITHQGEEVTLWIRDFKQKYAREAYHWIKDLQELLPRTGQKLAKIVVNGKQLVHLNELIGGAKWQ